MRAHGLKQIQRGLRRDDGDELAFIRHMQGIEAEKLAGGGDLRLYGNRFFDDTEADAGLVGNLVERRREATTRWIAHQPQRAAATCHHIGHKPVQRG